MQILHLLQVRKLSSTPTVVPGLLFFGFRVMRIPEPRWVQVLFHQETQDSLIHYKLYTIVSVVATSESIFRTLPNTRATFVSPLQIISPSQLLWKSSYHHNSCMLHRASLKPSCWRPIPRPLCEKSCWASMVLRESLEIWLAKDPGAERCCKL